MAKRGNRYALPAFELAIETSLRQAMLLSLRWEWLDLTNRKICIPLAFRRQANKGVPAELPLLSRVVEVLRAVQRAINAQVFDTTVAAIVMIWKKSKNTHGIKNLRWHDLRRERASHFFEKGLHPMQLAAITGHKSLSIPRLYTYLKAEDLAVMLG